MTVSSPDINVLDFLIKYDLSLANPAVVVTNNSSGSNLAGCHWWIAITTPSATIIHKGTEAVPDHNGAWTTDTFTTWPQPFGQVEFGFYTAILYVKDSSNNIFSLTKTVNIIRPVGNTGVVQKNFGACTISADMRCELSKLVLEDKTNYSWQGVDGEIVAQKWTVVFPLDDTEAQPADFELSDAPNALVDISYSASGYQVVRTETRLYTLDDGQSVQVKYKLTQDFNVQCNIDLCPLLCEYGKLMDDVCSGSCTTVSDKKLSQINTLMIQAIIGRMQPLCGIDVAAVVAKVKRLGGFDCNCNVGGNGINGGSSATSFDYNITVNGVCGDIDVDSITKVGSNIVINLKDVSYDFKICDDSDLKTVFSIVPSLDSPTCKKTYCLNVDGDALTSYITTIVTEMLSSYSAPCCPVYLNVKDKDTNAAPPVCPTAFFPAKVLNVAGTAQIGLANNAADMVGIINADTGWSALGRAFVTGNCIVGFYKATPTTTLPAQVFIQFDPTGGGGGCVDNKSSYLIGFAGCDAAVSAGFFPYNVTVQYKPGDPVYIITGVTDYVDLVNKLNAEAHKPVAITFSALGNPSQVAIDDVNCGLGYNVQPLGIIDSSDLLVGAGAHMVSPNGGLHYFIDPKAQVLAGRACGGTVDAQPWHVIKKGNAVISVDTDSGDIMVTNVTTPLYPNVIYAFPLSKPVGTAFAGTPLYGGVTPSHWDVYFPTDLYNNSVGNIIFIVESTTGCLWRYDLGSLTETHAFQSNKLKGACPRLVVGGALYFSRDGNRLVLTGQSNTLASTDVLIMDVTLPGGAFTATELSVDDFSSVLSADDEIWAISSDPTNSSIAYFTSQKGTIIKRDIVAGTNTVYAGAWNVTGSGFTGLTNTHIYSAGGVKRMYCSSVGKGTRVIDLGNIAGGVTIFDTLLTPGVNVNHYNFLPIPGKCYGYLTYENGGAPGGVAVYTLDGKYISKTVISGGNNVSLYNVVSVGDTLSGSTPNGLC